MTIFQDSTRLNQDFSGHFSAAGTLCIGNLELTSRKHDCLPEHYLYFFLHRIFNSLVLQHSMIQLICCRHHFRSFSIKVLDAPMWTFFCVTIISKLSKSITLSRRCRLRVARIYHGWSFFQY